MSTSVGGPEGVLGYTERKKESKQARISSIRRVFFALANQQSLILHG